MRFHAVQTVVSSVFRRPVPTSNTFRSRRAAHIVALTLLSLSLSRIGWAQPTAERRITIGAAAGVAVPFHGDFDINAPAWQADVRIDTTRHFGFGFFIEEWRHADEDVYNNQTITGQSGALGRVDRITIRTVHRAYTLGWSALARGRLGRVAASAGGGLGFFVLTRDFSQTMTGCEPTSLCRDTSSGYSNGSFAVHAQAGADIAMSARLSLMGQFRLVFPVQDPGSGHNSLMAGIRVGL